MAASTDSRASTRPLPPGSLGLPWIGESLAIAASNHGFYRDRFARYGPIFKTRLFGINFVVFSGAEAMHRFVTDPAIERGGVDPISVKQIFVNSLALVDGPEHRGRKAVMLEALQHRDALERWLPRMQRIIGATVQGWEERGRALVLPDLRLTSARLSGALYLGDEDEAHAVELDRIVHWMRGAFTTAPIAIPGTPYGRAIKGRRRLQEIIRDAIARHRSGDHDDVLATMMAAARRDGIPEEKLHGDLLHLLFASQGGFFVPLTLVTMAVAQHPEVMERARAEVLAVTPDGPVTMAQLDRLEYLGRVSKELRRFFAMNSATFFGRVTRDMEVGGYHIPAGWGAIGGIHITMRNPTVWESPERFDPDRFLPPRTEGPAPGSYCPHGHGARIAHRCPGEDLVTVAVKLHLALLLRRSRWELPPQDLTLSNDLFPLPVSGLDTVFHPAGARAGDLPRAESGIAHR